MSSTPLPNGGPADLPGFIWDPVRERYFGVPTSGLAYTERERLLAQELFLRAHGLCPWPSNSPKAKVSADPWQSLEVQILRRSMTSLSPDTIRMAPLGQYNASNVVSLHTTDTTNIQPTRQRLYRRRWRAYTVDWDPQMKT